MNCDVCDLREDINVVSRCVDVCELLNNLIVHKVGDCNVFCILEIRKRKKVYTDVLLGCIFEAIALCGAIMFLPLL